MVKMNQEDLTVKPFVRILIALLVASAVAVSCGKKDKGGDADTPKTAADYLKRAKQHFLDKDKAIKDLDKAIELDEDLAEAYEMRAEMYENRYGKTSRSKDAKRAIADYDTLMELEPASPKAAERLRKRGWLKNQLEDYDDAIADFTASLKKEKRASKTYEYLAESYLGKDDLENAAKLYGHAIKYDRNNATLYKRRARVYFEMENYEKSIAHLGKVIELQPDAEAYGARAQLYREIGEPQKALDDYEKARTLDPSIGEGGTVW